MIVRTPTYECRKCGHRYETTPGTPLLRDFAQAQVQPHQQQCGGSVQLVRDVAQEVWP